LNFSDVSSFHRSLKDGGKGIWPSSLETGVPAPTELCDLGQVTSLTKLQLLLWEPGRKLASPSSYTR
jgi:hypothetical protein